MTRKKISYLTKAAALVTMFCNVPLFAETVFVVGSYNNSAKASVARQMLIDKLDVPVQVTTASVANEVVHRLYIRNEQFLEDTATAVQAMGIDPWRLNLDLPRQARSGASNIEAEILVASFTSIDDALALERELADEGVDFVGNAELVAGKIVHQVWLKGLKPEEAQTRLSQLGLKQLAVRSVVGEPVTATRSISAPARAATGSARAVTGRSQVEAKEDSESLEKAANRPNRYPSDFNLARLPEKKSQ